MRNECTPSQASILRCLAQWVGVSPALLIAVLLVVAPSAAIAQAGGGVWDSEAIFFAELGLLLLVGRAAGELAVEPQQVVLG